MKQPLDEQDFQQDEACSSEQQASNSELRVNPGFVGQTGKEAILSHSSRWLLLGDQTTLLDSCSLFAFKVQFSQKT